MSVESHSNYHQENGSVVSYLRRDTYFGAVVESTSTVVNNLRQLQTELQHQHQHDKKSLTELNQRFQVFIDRIQLLQTQNSKYLIAISDLRRQYAGVNTIDVKWEENYFSLKSNFSSLSDTKIDYELDWELFQLQILIYQKLIDIEQHSKGNRIVLLEDELKQSASMLISLRGSYGELQREVEHYHAESKDLLKQYLVLTSNWCNMKKQQKKWYLNVETLKSYIAFYKNLRSQSTRQYDISSTQSGDITQFWTLELDKIVKKIRQDFEAFYAVLNREMIVEYETKTKELEINIQQSLHDQQIEVEQFVIIQEKLQIEYEQIQKSYSYEKEILLKLESSYSKLDAEFKSISGQNEQQFEIQSTDYQSLQETIETMVYNIDEIRHNKSSLELEIIIYRQLLEASGIEIPHTVIHRPPPAPTVTGTTRKISIRKQKKGWIGIKECAPNGTYISLMNYTANRTVDISRWVIARHIDLKQKLRYTIPDGIRLDPDKELRIYTKLKDGTASHGPTSYQILVNNNTDSWGTGDSIETYLFNQHGDEEATYSQSVAL